MARTEKSQAADRRLGDAIRAARMAKQLSQSDLAGSLGLTFQQVQKYEKGTNRVSAVRLVEIADFLGVDVATLYDVARGSRARATGNGELFKILRDADVMKVAAAMALVRDKRLRIAIIEMVRAAGGVKL